jgi:enoyl-CoA hydratase
VDNYAVIDRCFASDRLEDILAALEAEGSGWAAKELATLRTKSPTACKVSLRLLVESPRQFHFLDEMRLEYGIVVRMFRHPDFIEGVRALLIDKDNAPQWTPARPEDVTEDMIDRIFEPLPEQEAWTPLGADA